MTKTLLALLTSALLAPAALAAPADDALKPINQLIAGLNKGDMKAVGAAYAPGDITIIDEFAPHLWTGPKAAQGWAAGFDKMGKDLVLTDAALKNARPIRTEVDATTGYVVMSVLYTYKDHGKPMAEDGRMTFALAKVGPAWKIKGWTWTSPPPHAAK